MVRSRLGGKQQAGQFPRGDATRCGRGSRIATDSRKLEWKADLDNPPRKFNSRLYPMVYDIEEGGDENGNRNLKQSLESLTRESSIQLGDVPEELS